jgi:hypothetical protein
MNVPDFIDPDTFAAWCDYRREDVKAPFTDRVKNMAINRLIRLSGEGYDPNLILEHAVLAGWRGIYAHDSALRPKSRARETTVTDLRIVETSDKETAAAALAAMRQKAKRG